MPIRSAQLEFATTPQIGALFNDFADYIHLQPPELARMLAEENKHIAANAVDVIALGNNHRTINLLLNGSTHARKTNKIATRITRPTYEVYNQASQRLETSISYVARVAVLHGLVIEMRSENYSFES